MKQTLTQLQNKISEVLTTTCKLTADQQTLQIH